MRLEKAFSEDTGLIITAQEADRRFSEGRIKSKFNFQCPDDNCDAPVTCANLDRPKENRKRDPYYKIVGKHSSQCDLAKDIEAQSKKSKISSDIYSDSDEYIDNAVRLNLQPPSTKRPEINGGAIDEKNAEGKAYHGSKPESGKRKIQPSKTLSSLVDAYLAGESLTVQLPEIGKIDIKDLFVEINGQHIGELEDEWRVYYGKAWFNRKDSGYSIVFEKTLTSDSITKRPTTYLSMAKLQESGYKRFRLNVLEKIADKKPKMVFLLSETGPRINGGYINIWCDAPEYLDYRL